MEVTIIFQYIIAGLLLIGSGIEVYREFYSRRNKFDIIDGAIAISIIFVLGIWLYVGI